MRRFHFAFKVRDIESTRKFYVGLLGCKEGRSTDSWIDFDFFGNQLSAHVSESIADLDYCGKVDDVSVPIPHFGCILEHSEFEEIKTKLEKANTKFIIKAQTRYQGLTGEQLTMFLFDPSNNPIEFKSYTNDEEIFKV